MKKIIALTAVLSLLNPLPVNALSEEEAIQTADEYAGKDYTLKEAEKEGKGWEIEYLSKDAQLEITVDSENMIREIEYEVMKKKTSVSYEIDTKQAESVLKEMFPEAGKIRVRRKSSRKKGKYYKVTFKTEEYKGEAEISGSGIMLEYELKFRH